MGILGTEEEEQTPVHIPDKNTRRIVFCQSLFVAR